jgi:ABC-type transport system involved in cytochrome c biogenesis permease component
VRRELAVAARRKGTSGGRVGSGLIAFAILIGLLMAHGAVPGQTGPALLRWLSIVIFLECLIAGTRYTSDILSEEKRDGTLGLLFLTDLTGIDIVLGKMVSRSIGATYNLMATFPIFGLSLLFGGITGQQVVLTSIVLLVTTVWSLTVGIFVSSRGVNERKVVVGSLMLTAVFTLAPPCLWKALTVFLGPGGVVDLILYISPAYAFNQAGRGLVDEVLRSCWTLLAMGAVMAAYSSWRVQQFSREQELAESAEGAAAVRPLSGQHREATLPQIVMSWLKLREQGRPKEIMILSVIALAFGCFSHFIVATKTTWLIWVVLFGSYGLHVLYKFLITTESCRALNSAQRTGELELLLSTPLPPEFIIYGQIRATVKIWLPAALSIGVMNFLWMIDPDFREHLGVVLPCSWLLLAVDSYALAWRSILNALRGERFPKTVFKTFFQIIAPPMMAIGVILLLLIQSSCSDSTASAVFVFWTLVSVGYDIGLIVAAKARLAHFRELAAGDGWNTSGKFISSAVNITAIGDLEAEPTI